MATLITESKVSQTQPTTVDNLHKEIARCCMLLTSDIFQTVRDETAAGLYHVCKWCSGRTYEKANFHVGFTQSKLITNQSSLFFSDVAYSCNFIILTGLDVEVTAFQLSYHSAIFPFAKFDK